MADKEKNVDWVNKRDSCRHDAVFKLVVDRVKQDVERMNATQTAKRENCHFKVEEMSCKEFRVYGGSRSSVFIEKGEKTIEVTNGQKRSFTINHEWNLDKARCELKVGDEKLHLWQISQRALHKLFFG
ncbi:MAG: hypothetical protein F4223_07985 [Rhodobacteraceae bacterium]|nr:hypothetical protein [Paracoccaceae bacterium]